MKISILGKEKIYLKKTTSTQEAAKEFALAEKPEGTIVIAETQIKGRGRRQRDWFSPPGGLWFSIVLKPKYNLENISSLTLLTAVTLNKVLREYLKLNSFIDWPNDIVISPHRGLYKKVAGILAESQFVKNTLNFIIIGIGVNVNIKSFPVELKKTAASISNTKGKEIDKDKLLNKILEQLEEFYLLWKKNKLSDIFDYAKKYCITLKKNLSITTDSKMIKGLAVDISPKGGLILKLLSGAEKEIFTCDKKEYSRES